MRSRLRLAWIHTTICQIAAAFGSSALKRKTLKLWMVKSMNFATLDEEISYEYPEGYAVIENSKGGRIHRFLVRKAWNWLHRSRALKRYSAPVKTYSFGRAEEMKILEAVRGQINRMLQQGHEISDFAIICGAKTFYEITGAIMHDYTAFNSIPLECGFGGYRGTVCNMPLHVVPMMTGIAFVPKVAIEKRPPT